MRIGRHSECPSSTYSQCLVLLYFALCKSVGSENARLQMLCIFDVFSEPIFLIIASLCSFVFSFCFFSLVGSAHTRTLFVKSVAKTFVFCFYGLLLLLFNAYLFKMKLSATFLCKYIYMVKSALYCCLYRLVKCSVQQFFLMCVRIYHDFSPEFF